MILTVVSTVVLLILIYGFMIFPSLQKHPWEDHFKHGYFFHRGDYDNTTNCPENSMAAFIKAIDSHTGIETDIQLTRDNIPILHHDFVCQRTLRNKDNTPVRGKISDYTLQELCDFHILDSDQTVITFQEFLDTVQGQVPLILEIKLEQTSWDMAVCKIVAKMLETYSGIYCIESFHPGVVRWFKKNRKDILRGQLSSAFVKENGLSFTNFMCQNLLLNFLGRPRFIAYNHKYPNVFSLKVCQKLGAMMVCWTVKGKEEYDEAIKHFCTIILEGFTLKSNKE